jgi:hypothetical protein
MNSEKEKPPTGIQAGIQALKPKLMNVAMISAGAITAYGVSSVIWDMTKMFITLTPAATGYYGFIGGIVSTSICTGLMYYTERWYTIRPDYVFHNSLRMLNRDDGVRASTGHEGNFLLNYICNFHVLSHLLLIYICKLHWKCLES